MKRWINRLLGRQPTHSLMPFTDARGRWHVRIRHSNSHIILSSSEGDGYSRRIDAMTAATNALDAWAGGRMETIG